RSPNAETRVQSILHLLAIQSPESKKPLVDELALSRRFNVFYNPIRLVQISTPSDSRIMVAHILQMKGGDSRTAPILAKSYGQEPDVDARVATIYALGALQDPGAAPALEKGLRDAEVKRSEEHTSELSHVAISYAVFCLKKKRKQNRTIKENG